VRGTVYNPASLTLSRTARLSLALASGVALALAYPNFNLPVLAWVAPALLILAVLGTTLRQAVLLGWLQGAVFYFLTVPWIYTVMRQYGPLSVPAAAGVLILMVLICAAFHAGFALATAWIGRTGAARACLAAPFLWVSAEFLFLHFPNIGFPWNLLGYPAARNLAFVQLTTVTGIFGLSFVVAVYNALLAWVVLMPSVRRKRALTAWLGVTAVLLLVGWVGPRLVPQSRPDHVAHLVQTNFPQSLSYPSDWLEAHAPELDQLEQISVTAAQKQPGLVVWPEVPAPFSLQDGRFFLRARRIAQHAGRGFLLGVVDWKQLANGGIGAYNSAALLGPNGTLDFLYDKIHLVPFGEYVPWRKWLFFAGKLTADIGDFQHGTEYRVGHLPGDSFSVFICYEAIFPNLVRHFTEEGAGLLINISNDGWFGGSAAPAQHLAMARVRAVENRRWLLRDTNNGITASVDPYGRIITRLPSDIRGELDAPYGFRTDTTIYVRWGDWLAWLCVAASLVLLLLTGAGGAMARRAR
jgi:apolipoprotein N-acyltransferase